MFGASFNGLGQATATWALTSDGTAAVVGNVSAADIAIGSGVDLVDYNAQGIIGRWWSTNAGSNADDYFEYTISPNSGYNLVVNQLSFYYERNDDGPAQSAVYYSLDGFSSLSTQIGSNLTVGTVSTPFDDASLSIAVNNGETLTIRIYAWQANKNNGRFFNRDVQISGTATADCSNDTEPPLIEIDSYTDVISLSSGDCNAYAPNLINLATYTDNCTPSYDKWTYTTQSPDIGAAMAGPGTHTITVTASDASGNSQDYFFDIEVIDDIDPSISCQGTILVDPDSGECYYTVTGTELNPNSFGDNCSAVITNNITGTNSLVGEQFYDGDQVTWTATDPSGNTTDCTITVDLNFWNSVLSISSCPADIDLSSSDGNPVIATWTEPIANITGNGCILSFTSNYSPGDSFPVGTTTVTYTAEDGEGNTEQCSFDVSVAGVTGYCDSYGSNQYDDRITLVSFNTINNEILVEPVYDDVNRSYVDYTSISTDVSVGNSYGLTVNIDTDGSFTNYSMVWIDWNQNGDFSEVGESFDLGTAYDVSDGSSSNSPLSINIPSTALLGNTRMRVSTKFSSSPTECEIDFDGEVQDYTLNIIASCAISVFNVTGTGSYCSGESGLPVGLDDSETGVTYELYRDGTALGITQAGTGSAISFGDQTTAGTYTVVGTLDGDGCTLDMTGSAIITILPLPDPAVNPNPTSGASDIIYDGAGVLISVSWDAVAGATSYDVYFGAGSLPGTVTSNVVTNSFSTGTLSANTTYYWKVVPKNSCGDAIGASTWTFTTANIANCSGNADNVIESSSISNPNNALDPPDDKGAELNANGAVLVLDLTDLLDSGGSILIRLSRASGGGSHFANVKVDLSENGLTWTNDAYSGGVTTNWTNQEINLTTKTRYIRITRPSGTKTLYVDAVSYDTPCSPPCSISAFNVTGTGSYCSGESGLPVGLDDSETGVTYELYRDGTALGITQAGTGSAISFGDQTTAGTYTVVGTLDGDGCTLEMTGSAVIAVTSLSAPIALNASRCGDGDITISATPGAGETIDWYAESTGGIALLTGSTSYTISGLSATTTYYAEARNTTTGCTSAIRTAVIASISTPPTIVAGGAGTYCVGLDISLSSSGSGVSNQYWTGPNSFYSLLANPTITNATSAMSGTYTVTGSALTGVNLITNGSFEMRNFGFSSSYVFQDSTCTTCGTWGPLSNEATYSVVANPQNVHTNFSACADHSFPGTFQMVVNGATTAGVTVWGQSVNVVPDTDYQFTYWIQSVVASNPSRLQLYVNGVVAGPVYTANTATCSWVQFTYNWNSGSNTIADLSLENMNTIGGGNDFALDDIVFQQACTSTASVDVVVTDEATPSVSISADPVGAICAGTSVTFTATPVNGGLTPSYQWKVNGSDVGISSSTYSYSPANNDVVSCVLTSSLSCASPLTATSNTITETVSVLSTAATSITGTTTICGSSSTTLSVSGGSLGTGASWNWYTESCGGTLIGTGSSITVSPTVNTVYYVRAEGDCNTTTCVSVNVIAVDTTPPVLSNCPTGTITFVPDAGFCSTLFVDGDTVTFKGNIIPPTVTDNCDSAPEIYFLRDDGHNNPAGDKYNFPVGSTIVTFYAVDVSGNTSVACGSLEVIVRETTAPTMNCPSAQNIFCSDNLPAAYSTLAEFVAAGGSASDDADGIGCGIDDSSFAMITELSSGNTVTRTYQIADYSGNTITCEHVFTITQPTVSISSFPETTNTCVGDGFTISSSISGYSGTAYYQWEERNSDSDAWVVISGESSDEYTGTLANFGHQYRVSIAEVNDFSVASCVVQSNVLTYEDEDAPEWINTGTEFITRLDGSPGSYSYSTCSATNSDLAITNMDVSDNCSSFAGFSVQYSIDGGSLQAGDARSYSFLLGTTAVHYEITDENNNTLSIDFDVIVNNEPTLGTITTDGAIATDGSGYRPYQGTQHIYSVTNDSGYDYTWRVENSSSTNITGSLPNSGQGTASFTLTWDADAMPGTYTVYVIKQSQATGCESETSLSVTVLNGFNPKVQDFGDACHEVTGSTLMDFVVYLETGTRVAPEWYFDWTLYLDGTEIQTGSSTVTGVDSKTVQVTVNVGDGSEKIYRFVISNGLDSLGNTDIDISIPNNEDSVKIFALPSIQF